MSFLRPISLRIIATNVVMVLAWIPLIFVARGLIEQVIAGSPSEDLLEGAYLAVIGTLIILTAVYLFAIVLVNKFATQNLGDAQGRIVKPVIIAAAGLYTAVAIALF